jgi:serine/threonine protein kinase
MQNSRVTRKGTLRRLAPEKKLSNLHKSESSSSFSEFSSDCTVSAEVVTPNPVNRTHGLKSLNLKGSPSAKAPLSPRLPFGPKTKACIIPCKDLSDTANAIEMDALENYNIWSDIGKGSYATVKLATHKITMQKCAIKIYSKKSLEDPTLKKNVKREIKILKKIDHNNIVKFYEEILGDRNLYIVMEYVKGIALNNYLVTKGFRKLDECEARNIIIQLFSALAYCHERSITHRDIKLENIQLDLLFNVKLIDFGFATCFSNTKKSLLFCGSPSYMAPEIIRKEEFYGPPVDIWAAGIVLYVLITGVFPFKGNTEKKVFDKVLLGKYDFPEYVSELCRDAIVGILNPNPAARPTAGEVLRHPWMISSSCTVYTLPRQGDNGSVSDDEAGK